MRKLCRRVIKISCAIGLLIGGLGFSHVSQGASVLLFSDSFDQASSTLTNGWKTPSGFDSITNNSAPRVAVSNDGLVAGVGGTQGLLLEGAGSANPDEGIERSLATHGMESLTFEYTRIVAGFGTSSIFNAEYSFDGEPFVPLESVATDVSSTVVSFPISNPLRFSKLTIRFSVNGVSSTEEVGIDDVSLQGDNAPLFYDGFESGNFTSGGWVTEKTPTINTTASNVWTDNNGMVTSTGHAADIGGSTSANPDDALNKLIDTTGVQNIKLRYARKLDAMSNGDNFHSLYSVDGGSSWTDLEVTQNSPYVDQLFSLSAIADNNPQVKIRFEVNASSSAEDAFLDDVIVWGEPIPPPPPPPQPEVQTARITVIKQVINDHGGTKQVSDFPLFVGSLPTDSGVTNEVLTGDYIIHETSNSQYATTIDGDCNADGTITLHNGDDKTCIITNDDIPGHLIVKKMTYPAGDPAEFLVSVDSLASLGVVGPTGTISDADDHNFTLAAGTYTVTEDAVPSWRQIGSTCENISIALAETKTCEIVNQKQSRIVVNKISVGGVDTFTFAGFGPENEVTVTTEADSVAKESFFDVFTDLEGSSYSITEEPREGWSANESQCALTLLPGETKSCQFVNFKKGKLRVHKQTIGGDGEFHFNGTGIDPFSIVTHAGEGIHELILDQGVYSINELSLLEEWRLVSNTCLSQSIIAGAVSNCTITNTKEPNDTIVEGTKFHDRNRNGRRDEGEEGLPGWIIRLSNMKTFEERTIKTDEAGNYIFKKVTPGKYVLKEEKGPGWMPTKPGAAFYTFTIKELETIMHDFGNVHSSEIMRFKVR